MSHSKEIIFWARTPSWIVLQRNGNRDTSLYCGLRGNINNLRNFLSGLNVLSVTIALYMPIIDWRRKNFAEFYTTKKKSATQVSQRKSTIVFDKNHRSVSIRMMLNILWKAFRFKFLFTVFSSLIFALLFVLFKHSYLSKNIEFMILKSRII